MGAALGWGAIAASSLVIGALLGVVRSWPAEPIGLVLAFGAGALISAVSFDLAQEGAQIGSPGTMATGLGLGVEDGVGVGLLAAIFVSNLPEAIGSATDSRAAGRGRRQIVRLWVAVE